MMNCFFRKKTKGNYRLIATAGFSLIEVMTALIILAMVCSSVLVIINRCMASVVDSQMQIRAFEVARENMERILSSGSVTEMVDYGSNDKYPDIRWENTIEVFNEPQSGQSWVRAICSAEYTDNMGEPQKIELEHWLSQLTAKQQAKYAEQKAAQQKWLEEQGIEQQGEQQGEQGKQEGQEGQEQTEREEPGQGEPRRIPERPDNIPHDLWEAIKHLFEE